MMNYVYEYCMKDTVIRKDLMALSVFAMRNTRKWAQAAQTYVTRCNVIYILTFSEAERDLWASRYRITGDR